MDEPWSQVVGGAAGGEVVLRFGQGDGDACGVGAVVHATRTDMVTFRSGT
jgi:hypothetical protein